MTREPRNGGGGEYVLKFVVVLNSMMDRPSTLYPKNNFRDYVYKRIYKSPRNILRRNFPKCPGNRLVVVVPLKRGRAQRVSNTIRTTNPLRERASENSALLTVATTV